MCHRFVLTSPLEAIARRFGVFAHDRLEWQSRYIVSPGDETLVLTQHHPKQLVMSSFGMTPSWSGQQILMVNARAEGNKNRDDDPMFSGAKAIFMNAAFKKPLFSQRCAVIADAFLVTGPQMQPFLVYLRNRERPFAMAGLFDIWKHPESGLLVHGFTIVTVPGNALLRQLQNTRMPVILPKGRETDWLKGSFHLTSLLKMLEMYSPEKMNAYPLAGDLSGSETFTRDSLLPVGPPVYREMDLNPLQQRYYNSRPRLMGNVKK